MKSKNTYKSRKTCPCCLSLSIKKSYKFYKCDRCKNVFQLPLEVLLMHKNNRCIDNDVDSRHIRLIGDVVIYKEA